MDAQAGQMRRMVEDSVSLVSGAVNDRGIKLIEKENSMSTQIVEIESYQVSIPTSTWASAIIFLMAKNQSGFHSRYFFRRTEEAPRVSPSGNGVNVFMPASQYPNVLDLLRNEKPVYLHIHDSSGASLTTRAEPIGEGELEPSL